MKRLAILVPLLAIAPLVAARAEDPATNAPAEPAGGGTPKRTSTAFSTSDPESEIEAKRSAVEQMIADAERSFNHQDLVECFKTHPFDDPGGDPDKKAWGVYFDAYDWSLDASELLDVLHAFDCPVGFSATCAGTFDLDRLLGLDLRALIVNPASDKDRIGSEDAIVGAPLQFFAWHSWTNVTVLAKTRTLVCVDISNEGPPLDASPLAELPTLKDLHLWGDWYFRDGRFPGTKLENLYLGGNSVLGVFPELGGNGLSGLMLFNTSVTNLSALRDQPLACVEISKTPVRDLSFLRGNKSLKELELRETEVRDLAPLAETGLEHLSLECNPVDGYAPVLGLPELDLIVKTESGWLGREDILKMSAPATNAPAAPEPHAETAASAPHAEGAESAKKGNTQ